MGPTRQPRRRPRRRVGTLAATSGLALATLAVGAGPVSAQDAGCDDVVVDETGQLDVAAVEGAAADLQGLATPRVRFYPSVPGGDLDAAVEDLIQRCWAEGGVEPQRDVVVLAVSLGDRRTVLRWGDGVDALLADGGDQIDEAVINPRLADGEPTEAVVAGLVAVGDELTDEGAAGPVAPSTEGGAPWVPLGVAGAVVLLGGGAVGLDRRRRLRERRSRLDEALQEPIGRAGDLRERWRQLEQRAAATELTLTGGTLARIGGLRAEARDLAHRTDASVILFRQALPDGLAEADHRQLSTAEDRLADVVALVAAHDAALSALDRALRRLDERRRSLPTKVGLIDEELDDSRELAAQRAAEGWRTDELAPELDRLDRELAAVDLSPLRLDVDAVSVEVERIEGELFATRHALQSLPERRAGLQAWAEELAGSVALQRRRLDAARSELARLATLHDPASFASLVDNPDTAVAELDRSDQVRRAVMDGPFAEQAWDEAGRGLEVAGLHLVRADDELDEVDRSSVELEDARARGPQQLAAAREALAEVQAFVAAHDEDLGPRFDTEPAAVGPVLDGLAHELDRPRPNHLRVLQTAEQVVADLDALLGEARSEQSRVAALRRLAAHEEATATALVARARQALGWQLFPTAEAAELTALEQSLQELPTDLEARTTAARAIGDAAQRIEVRAVNRRRRGGIWIVGGTMGTGWSGGGGGGSSGGGGFGGGSFGGGGFGGGSFGGGGFGGGFGGGGGGGSSW